MREIFVVIDNFGFEIASFFAWEDARDWIFSDGAGYFWRARWDISIRPTEI